jgi:hypothetical protein
VAPVHVLFKLNSSTFQSKLHQPTDKRVTGSYCMLYYVTHFSPTSVQNMSQCISHNSCALTAVRLTTNYFWQQQETYNNTIINLSSRLVYAIITIISSTAPGRPWPPQYMQCKVKCTTTWSFLSAKTLRFPTSAKRQHPSLTILIAERICNHRNVGLWNISIMCLISGVTEWEADNAWRFPTVLHCNPIWQGQVLNMNDEPQDWFTDVKNLCLATLKNVYILLWRTRGT